MNRLEICEITGQPRFRLLYQETPLEPALGWTGHPDVLIKRDDAIPLGLGGNKLRSLEYWLGAALAQKSDVLVVAGAVASNQVRLTAAAAVKAGLPCRVLYDGDAATRRIGGNQMLTKCFGAEISFLGPVNEAERAAAARAEVKRLRAAGRRPYLIGEPTLGALGYVRAAQEVMDQAKSLGKELAHIVIPGAMGPTEAGFLAGLLRAGFGGLVHVVSVEYLAEEMRYRIHCIYSAVAKTVGVQQDPDIIARYDDSYLGEGYGHPTPKADAAISALAKREALLLEPTYTAKPMAALLAMIAEDKISADETTCFLHTGGIPSLFASPQKGD